MYDIINKLSNIEFNFNVNIKSIAIFLILFLFVSLVIFIIVSYIVIKLLKRSIDDNNILFYQYSKKCQQILDVYGDCKLTKLYLVRQPFSKIITFLLNIATFYNYEKIINESSDNFPYHTMLVFEVVMPNKTKKWIILEKNNCINISDNFFIHSSQEMKEIKLPRYRNKNKLTIKSILQTTQERVGNEKFFNWHLYKNNCQEFTKEILITIDKYTNKNKQFIFRDKIMKLLVPSEFTIHIGNCICVYYNIFEKYVCDNNLFP
jgi:hypothetical protein